MFKKIFNRVITLNILKMKLKRKGIKIARNSYIDSKSSLKGANTLAPYSSVINSMLGFGTYIGGNTKLLNTKIEKYTSIGQNVSIIFGQHPTHKFVSTHPSFYSLQKGLAVRYTNKQLFDEYRYADNENKISVLIGNDVWIGDGVKIMEGIIIGDGAIVAAGSIVTKHVPEYAIVGGVPAKVIRYRFSNEDIEFLLKLQWWNESEDWIKQHSELFQDIEKLKGSFFSLKT
ncbi:CatB-related O-acetyltransferase [Metabacillus litoralis]|uniref:CatB-related O-acetyltransferase n=1 Tax=Metabacillus litoralis TaxID=152268 RepID=A0A5C6VED7_9BACI|nr:CatB-related O-acetyltransferase [Metabacillus litoralis]TXC82185.1 CatB-related O-acetyltransferase [Metabacillus litoralis]